MASLSLSFFLPPPLSLSFCLKAGSFPELVLNVLPNQPYAAKNASSGQLSSTEDIPVLGPIL